MFFVRSLTHNRSKITTTYYRLIGCASLSASFNRLDLI